MSIQNGTSAAAIAGAPAHGGRRRSQRGAELRKKVGDSTLVQALIAGALSFTHIRDVALHHGQAGWKSWAYPLSVDLITVAAYRRLKNDQAAGDKTGVAWTWFIIGLTASLGANIADAITNAPADANPADLATNIIIGMWPAAAFLGSTLLRHSAKPTTDRPTERPTDQQRPTVQPTATVRPTTSTVQQQSAVNTPPPIPVKPAVQPTAQRPALGDLGPHAEAGKLRIDVWVEIGRPVYEQLKKHPADRPTERALQSALSDRVAELITAGALPAAVGQPSLTTAKRVRRAIEARHPELTAQPRRLAIAGG